MTISDDYLDIDSAAGKELLQPLASTIHDHAMFVRSCNVDVVFKTYQQGWLGKSESVEHSLARRDFTEQDRFFKVRSETCPVSHLVKKLATLTESEKDPALVVEVCAFTREDLKRSNEIVCALTLASLGKNEAEIQARAVTASQGDALIASTKETIEKSSDLELFQYVRFLLPNLESLVKQREEAFAAVITKSEVRKVSDCYRQAMNKVRYRIDNPQLMDMEITVVLAKRSDPKEQMAGHYQISNKQWTWESASVK